jgi:quercetin dioxygenase-like cupin family protein
MPIIDHSTQARVDIDDFTSDRALVTRTHGAVSLTIREVMIEPGGSSRLCTHPTDTAIMVQEGSIQMVVGEEVQTVRSGYTLLAPPGVPYKLLNNTWVVARLLVISPTAEVQTEFLE